MKYLGFFLSFMSCSVFASISLTSESSAISTQAATIQSTHKVRHKSIKSYSTHDNNLSDMVFDFSYSGDVSGLPIQLRNYDSNLNILHSLGTKKPINVNISLQAAKLVDISEAISTQTNNQVSLIYNSTDNSIKLNYISVIDTGNDAVSESLKWQQGGNPRPILKQDGIVRFPYGEYQPVVICQPLNLCDIELQSGEEIQGIVIGDSERWNQGDQGVPIVYSGPSNKLTPHLVLKPSQAGLDTTLMVTTSKRTYMIRLKSASNNYVARAGFYYPSDIIQTFDSNKNQLKESSVNLTKAVSSDLQMPLIDLSKVNYGYTLSSGDYIWRPTQVFDDGISVYIQLPDGVSSRSLPGLCILIDGDDSETKCEMVNFRFNNHFYIVDNLFNKAKLVNGYGDYIQTITITRKADKPGFWSRIFN